MYGGCAIQKSSFAVWGFLLHQFDDSGLGSIAAADAGADDAGVAAVALGIFRSDLLEQLVGDGGSYPQATRCRCGSIQKSRPKILVGIEQIYSNTAQLQYWGALL